MLVAFVTLALVSVTRADWPNGDPTKWLQLPDLTTNGLDVLATQPKILANDFLCTNTGPITGIHIWGSWTNDYVGSPNFTVQIYTDQPTNISNPYSHPSLLLWSNTFTVGQYATQLWATANEQFFDPNTTNIIATDTQVIQYNFSLPTSNLFFQTSGTVYWVAISATNFGPELFGWKTTSTNEHWNDNAVYSDNFTNWFELRYPTNSTFAGSSIDLSMALTAAVPEPSILLLGVVGGGVMIAWRRRQKNQNNRGSSSRA